MPSQKRGRKRPPNGDTVSSPDDDMPTWLSILIITTIFALVILASHI